MPWTGRFHVAYCDECHKKWPRSQLVRKLTETGHIEGQNLFIHSSYNHNLWEVISASEIGLVSMGPFMYVWDTQTINDGPGGSGFITEEDTGSFTFSGNGIVRSIISTDVTSMSNVLFGVSVGRNHRNQNPSKELISLDIGYYNSTTATYYPRKSYVFGNSKRCVFIDPIDDIPVGVDKTQVDFYVDVSILSDPQYTNHDYWYVEDFHLVNSNGRLQDIYEIYIPTTSGSTVVRDQPGYEFWLPVICPDCYDFISKTYEPTLYLRQYWSTPGWMKIITEGTRL